MSLGTIKLFVPIQKKQSAGEKLKKPLNKKLRDYKAICSQIKKQSKGKS